MPQKQPAHADEDFAFPILTVDGVVFQLLNSRLHVLLILRGFEPFLGAWALPGVYIPREETSRRALERALVEKTGISTSQFQLIEQPYAFDAPERDPRGYAVTVMYMGLGRGLVPGTHPGMSNGQEPTFLPLANLPPLAYDHSEIVAFAHHRLKSLTATTNAVGALISKTFTLSELQSAYEAILGKKIDKRNFRKKILGMGMLAETDDTVQQEAHRPARLYRFSSANIETCTPDL